MKVEINESASYAAWIVSSDFGTSSTHRIYMKVLDPGRGRQGQPDFRPSNLFANKHLGQDPETILKMRRFQGVSESAKWEALERLGVKLNAALNPSNAPHTNTVIDFSKIDRKNAAYLIARALFEGMIAGTFGDYQQTKESGYINRFEVNFGIPCVVSAGNLAGVESGIQIGVKRVTKLNPQKWVSFEVNHCAGALTPNAP